MVQDFFNYIIDDFIRFTWAVTIKNKVEVTNIVESFYLMVKNQFGKSIKILRYDNGLEFNLFSFFNKYSIIH